MALSGDLRNIKLADIFQTLSMNRQVGLVVLRRGSTEKRLYFSRDGVSLFSRRTMPGFRLGRHLVGAGKLTEEKLAQALAHQEQHKGLLGEILVELGLCEAEDIEQIIRYHVAEEIYELFTWESGDFEFLEADTSEASEEAAPFCTVSFDPGGVVMEAARRIDEWDRIRLALPDREAILVRTGEEGERLDPEVWGHDPAAVYGLVNGFRSMLDIVDEYYLAAFETASILAELVRESLIRMASDSELCESANRLFECGEIRRASRLFERARPARLEDSRLLERLAACYEALEARREAADALTALASLRAVRMETADAINLLERATRLDPSSPAPLQILMGLYRDLGDHARAAACATRAGELFLSQDHADAAEDVCRHVLDLVPQDMALHAVLANACIALGNKPAAIDHLGVICAHAEAQGDERKFREVAEKVLQLEPARQDLVLRLELLMVNRQRRRRRVLAALAGAGGVFSALLVAAILLLSGGAGAEERMGRAWDLLQRGDIQAAVTIAQTVIEEDGHTEAALQAQNLLHAAGRRHRPDGGVEQEDENRRILQTLAARFAPIREAFAAREWSEGFEKAVGFVQMLGDTKVTGELDRLPRAEAAKVRDDLRRDLRAILEMYAQHVETATRLNTSRTWPVQEMQEKKLTPVQRSEVCLAASRIIAEIVPETLRRNLASAEIIELALPPGDRKFAERAARGTETLLRIREETVRHYHLFRAPLRRDEVFQSFTTVRQSVAEHLMTGQLEKARELCVAFLSVCRELSEEEPREYYASVVQELLSDSGLDLDGKVRRDFELLEEVLERIAGAEALVAQGRLDEANGIFLGIVRDHYRLNLRSRVRLAARVRTIPAGASLRLARAAEPDQELGPAGPLGVLVRFPCWGTTRLIAELPTFRTAEREIAEGSPGISSEILLRLEKVPLWVSAESGPVDAAPAPWNDALLVPSRDGHLRAFARADGRLLLDHDTRLLSGLAGTPLVTGDRALLLAPDRTLIALDVVSGRKVLEYACERPVRCAPVLSGAIVVVADESGCVRGFRGDREIWRATLSGPVKTGMATAGGLVFAGTTESVVHCLDAATGRQTWERDTGAPVFTPLAVHGNLLLVGTEGSELVAFSVENGQIVWRQPTENACRGRLAVRSGVLFAASLAGRILRFDVATGRPLESYANPSDRPFEIGVTLVADGVCAVDADGVLHLLDNEGRPRWTFGLGERVTAEPVSIEGRLYLATESGRIVALDEGH